jgi:hypothetical protein
LTRVDYLCNSIRATVTGAKKGVGCTAASAAGLDARRPTLKAGKALIFGKSRHARPQSVRDCHTRNLKGEPIEEPVAVPAA